MGGFNLGRCPHGDSANRWRFASDPSARSSQPRVYGHRRVVGGRYEPPCAHGESSDAAREQYIAGAVYKYRTKSWRRRCCAGWPDSRESQSPARLDHLSSCHRTLLVFCATNLALDQKQDGSAPQRIAPNGRSELVSEVTDDIPIATRVS